MLRMQVSCQKKYILVKPSSTANQNISWLGIIDGESAEMSLVEQDPSLTTNQNIVLIE